MALLFLLPPTPVSLSMTKLSLSAQTSKYHHQRPCRDQCRPDQRFGRETLVQENKRQHKRDHDAQLIDRHHFGDLANLQRSVITEPGGPGSQPGQDQKQPAFLINRGKAALCIRQKDHPPGHRQYYYRADGRRQIGIYPLDPHLGQNRCQRRKNRRQYRKYKPHDIRFPFTQTHLLSVLYMLLNMLLCVFIHTCLYAYLFLCILIFIHTYSCTYLL